MTPLRQQMIAAMRQRGFSVRTHESYLHAVAELARFHGRAPDALEIEALQQFFDHLVQVRDLSPASCRLYLHGIRFLYLQVLQWPSFDVRLVLPRRPERIPQLLSRAEVARIVSACTHPKHRMLLETTYGCGLRVSEVVAVRVADIDGERGVLRIEQGKGAKDRLVTLAPRLLERLRDYWRGARPLPWLFPSHTYPSAHVSITTAQKSYTRAKARAGVTKVGGIHALRHAYATHQLGLGLPVHELQRQLGHTSLHSTQRYVHWAPQAASAHGAHADLVAALEVARD